MITRFLFAAVLLVSPSCVLPQDGAVVSDVQVSASAPDSVSVMRELLSGAPSRGWRAPDKPFTFRTLSGLSAVAQGRGLEGFYFSKTYLEDKLGAELFSHHDGDYFGYADYLLMRRADFTYSGRQMLQAVKGKDDFAKRNSGLNTVLGAYVSKLQKDLMDVSPSKWAYTARIYEIFPRAYNLAGRRGLKSGAKTVFFRDFSGQDFAAIKAMGFDTVWPMGIYPVGLRGRSGTAGGSVYSIRDPEHINPELGGDEAFRVFVDRAHAAGLKVIVDFVPNHSSMDSVLLEEDTDYYISSPVLGGKPDPAPPGSFSYKGKNGWLWVKNGGYDCMGDTLCTWNDVAQFDYSNPKLRRRQTDIVVGLARRFKVDGFRVDMAYQLLNPVFARNWNVPMPQEEFLSSLIKAVREVNPSAAFIAEAYDNQDQLSSAGFDLIYNKSEWGRPEGNAGWYDSMAKPTAIDVAAALERASFLSWRRGGAGGLNFFINHDEPSARKVFGPRLPAVAAATMFLPGAFLFYNGAEIGFDAAVPGEEKTLPFSVPVWIDWNGGDRAGRELFDRLFADTAKLREYLGDCYMRPLPQPELHGWAGYVLYSRDFPRRKKAVLFNYSSGPVKADLGPDGLAGFRYSAMLETGGYRLLDPYEQTGGK